LGQRVPNSFVVRFDQGRGRTGSNGGRIAKEQAMDFFELVSTGTPQDVQAAISNGADVNVQSNYGRIPMMEAAKWNPNPEVIIVLLKAGTDVNARDRDGRTPLMFAARYNSNPEVITSLLKAGTDAKAKDNYGYTVFDDAQKNAKLKGTDALQKLEEASK
jgi:ankyrin repeat protein